MAPLRNEIEGAGAVMLEHMLLELVEETSDDAVPHACELAATPNETPPGHRRKAARLRLARLKPMWQIAGAMADTNASARIPCPRQGR